MSGVQVEVTRYTPDGGAPVLVATGIDDNEFEPETLREIAEQLRDQLGPECRVIVINGLTLSPAHADMAVSLLRAIVESYDVEPASLLSTQFDVAREFIAALDRDSDSLVEGGTRPPVEETS